MAGLVATAPLQTTPQSATVLLCSWNFMSQNLDRIACLCSKGPGVSAEKTQELGVTRQLGARMIRKCFYSYVWGQGPVSWNLGLTSNYMWPSCSLTTNMVASGQMDFLAGGSALRKRMSQWTRQKWHYLRQPSLENHIASFHCTPFVKAVVSPSRCKG